jgi:Ca2+-binding RTX toxin-like protein
LGGGGNDRLKRGAGAGTSFIYGFSGNDHLEGRGSDDTLRGGRGVDFLDGGAGLTDFCFGGETVLNCELSPD